MGKGASLMHRLGRVMTAVLLALVSSHCATSGGDNGEDPNTPPPVGPGPATVVHSLEVRHHNQVRIEASRVDAILDDASRVLRQIDQEGDVSADVLLNRIGALTRFSRPDGFINSSSDFRRHCNLGAQVFVVNEINWCGQINASIIGCADRPGSCLAVVRINPTHEGLLWAHEFGHNAGLDHRNQRFALMADTLNPSNRVINASERDAFLNYQLLPPGGLLEAEYLAQHEGGASDPLPPVLDFIRQTFVRGVPYASASRYTRQDAEQLLSLMDDPDYQPFRANMITIVAAVADPSHVDNVIRFFESGSGQLSHEEYNARRAALFGLAYMAHQDPENIAMAYLIASLDPSVWSQRALEWSLPYAFSPQEQWQKLSELAVLATALSGTPEAGQALRDLQGAGALRAPRFSGLRATAPPVDELLQQALQEHAKVARQGLEAYSAAH